MRETRRTFPAAGGGPGVAVAVRQRKARTGCSSIAFGGTRVVAGVVIVLLVAAVLVVLARVGLWQQAFVSERMVRLSAWALAEVFVLETLAAFTWSRGTYGWWWLYGPVSLVVGVLALIVAGSDGAWPHLHWPHRTLPGD